MVILKIILIKINVSKWIAPKTLKLTWDEMTTINIDKKKIIIAA